MLKPKYKKIGVSGDRHEKLTFGRTTKSGTVKTKTINVRDETLTKTKVKPNGKSVTKTKPLTNRSETRTMRGR